MEKEFLRQTLAAGSLGDLVATGAIGDILQRQTAIQLHSGTDSLWPLYHQIAFPVAAMEARVVTQLAASADPVLLRHLATRLDQRMFDILQSELGGGGVLDMLQKSQTAPVPVHLNLTLEGLGSKAFAAFSTACAHAGAVFGVEINIIEVAADPKGFAAARSHLDAAAIAVVIGGITHLTLQLARPWLLRPRLMKLDWSPRLPNLDPAEARRLDSVLADIGPASVVLCKAETELALHWGLTRGIRKFQGRHVDAMLGASRLVACSHARHCTLRQCIERAGASGPAGRVGCLNTSLLDAGVPPPAKVAMPSVLETSPATASARAA